MSWELRNGGRMHCHRVIWTQGETVTYQQTTMPKCLITLLIVEQQGVQHAFKSRTLWLKSVFKTQNSFQNKKSAFKTQNQLSKHKSAFKTQIQFLKHKLPLKYVKSVSNLKYIQLQFSKTSFTVSDE